jgi:two-component system nitrate/nitrite response regulator NarL
MPNDSQVDPPRPSRIRAFLVSDVRLYREGVHSALVRRDAIDVVGTASSIGEAIERVASLDPAVIIIDMATRDSLSGVRSLAVAAPLSKIVVFAVDEHATDVPAYAEAGIAGYVPADASIDDLAATIVSVTRDEVPCSPRVAGALFRRIATLAAGVTRSGQQTALSHREQEILALIRGGLSNKDIARTLTIEVATVKNHVHSLLTKLKVSTRAEAAVLCHTPSVRLRINGI